MPAAIAPALMIGGSLLGGLGKSGQQGSQSELDNMMKNFSSTSSGTMTPTEPGYATDFRKGQMQSLNEAIAQAQTPVYGEAQKAAYLNSLNDLAKSATDSLTGNLARSGALNSGRAASAENDINMGRVGQAASFFSQIPMLNQQARTAAETPLLNIGAGLAGKAPTGYTQTGSQQGTEQDQGTKQISQQGPGFLKSFLGNLGGLATGYGGGIATGAIGNPFGRNGGNPPGISGGNWS